jgi:DNA polymerase III sliding clamp (beta) subunit (PCNA family)
VTIVTFENAALADAIKKAERVAPSRGSAFDKAAGIVIEASDQVVCIRATDTTIYYTEWIGHESFDGDPVRWRIPSKLLAQVVTNLPIGTGKSVSIEQDGNKLTVKSGRIKARLPLMEMDHFPQWQPFPTNDLKATPDVGGKLAMVEWAAAKDNQPPWAGIYLDGTWAIACDKYRLARTPLSIPQLDSPIIVPSNILSGLIRQTGEIQVGSEGNNLLIMPDDHTQITTVLFESEYPTLDRLINTEYPCEFTVRKAHFLEVANRVRGIVQADRMAGLQMLVGKEEVVLAMQDADAALMDVIDIPGEGLHDRAKIMFAPANLIEAVDKAPSEQIKIAYDPANTTSKVIRIDGGSGYNAWIAVRKD